MLSTGTFTLLLLLICERNCHPSLNGRIVGGTPTSILTFPHQLSLQYYGSHICGASILNQRYGLTAAHCVIGKSLAHLSISAGSSHYSSGVQIKVDAAKCHHNYNTNTSNFDIAIIKFSSELYFNRTIQPAILPAQDEPISSGTVAVVSGWGYTKETGTSVSTVLLKVEVAIVDNPYCKRLYRGKGVVTNRMLCAGIPHGGRDACQGDSGGPLTVNGKVIGVVSWGYGCARPGYPGVYTKVAMFVNWITRSLQRGI